MNMNEKTLGCTQDTSTVERGRLLSPDAANIPEFSTQLRSPSITPSISSRASHVTLVEDPSKVPLLDPEAVLRRRHTESIEVKISWWNCICGALFGPRIAERRAIANFKTTGCDDIETEGSDDEDPFVTTVYVLPSEKASSKNHKAGRCTFDTGCLQGNIISRTFAQKLGFTPSEFKPLKRRERNGGISATGHTHMPEGALYLSWYHNSSPRLFTNMRFLVSPNQDFDLLIGVRSIIKHKLLLPPNFGMGRQRNEGPPTPRHTRVPPFHDQLQARAQELKGMIETLENEQQELQGSFKGSKALLDAREKYTMIDKQIQLREAKKQLKGHPKDKNFEVIVKALENEIKEHETLEAKKTELSSAAKDLSKEPEDKNLKERVENLREELKKLRGESPEATAASPDGGNLKKPKKSKKPKKPGRTER